MGHLGHWPAVDPIDPYALGARACCWVIWAICFWLTQLTHLAFWRGYEAWRVMGHLGHLGRLQKSAGYNTVYSYCIHFYFLNLYL